MRRLSELARSWWLVATYLSTIAAIAAATWR